MTEALTAKCTKCGELKDATCFARASANRNGLFNWCKTCYNVYRKARRHNPNPPHRKPTPRGVAMAKKAIDVIEALPEANYNITKAYAQVAGLKNKDNGYWAANKFFEHLGEDEMALEMFRAYLTRDLSSIDVKHAFTEYFQQAFTEGSLGEKNQALKLTFQVLGWLDKRVVEPSGKRIKTKEERMEDRAKFMESLEVKVN